MNLIVKVRYNILRIVISLFTIFCVLHAADRVPTASMFNTIGLLAGVMSAVVILLGLAIILVALVIVR